MAVLDVSQLAKGDLVEINGQVLTVLEVAEGAASTIIHLSDDYMLRISGGRRELLKRTSLGDREEITAVALSSIKILK
jgi:hypothetical protein